MPWADTESGPSNVRDKATSRLFDTRTMSLVSDNTDQSCKLQITGHSSVDRRDKCLKSRRTGIGDNRNLRRLKHGALNVGADLLLIVVVIVIPTCLWFLAAHFVFQSLGRPEC